MDKILIIEDEIAFQKLIGDQLKKDGYVITSAEDGQKGLAMAKSQHPDLILLDLKLPEMDGLSVLSELREDDWGKTAKVIVLTNLEPDKDILAKVLENKPALYLVKSNIRLSELKEKILNVLL
jgi:CheY-like chemotaxis protein